MADSCPDNSTDCLLRAIYEADSGYNWDPVTFAFTAVFTLIALLVSVFALFQSFVAAGPGRLKASERAIGREQNQNRTKTQFSWKEFRYRTIVNVPVIDVKKILDYTPAVIPIADHGYKRQYKQEHKYREVIKVKGRVVAGWSQLLNDLSLADVKFNTIECLTDYLPDDVPAAPAWARMESILLLCIMKGCTRLVADDDGFISATGPSAQLSWNMHPTLGPMAIYRTWDVKATSMQLLDDVQKMVPTCVGELYLADEKLFGLVRKRRTDLPVSFSFERLKIFTMPSLDRCNHSHDHCENRRLGIQAGQLIHRGWEGEVDKRTAALASALFADRPAKIKAFPTRLVELNSALKIIYDEHFPWLILADDLDDSVLKALCGPNFVEFSPSEAISHPDLVDTIKLTSWVVVASQQNSSPVLSKPLNLDRPELYDPASTTGPITRGVPTQIIDDEKFSSSNLRVSRAAVRHLSRWFADDTYFESADAPELSNARQWLGYQLAEIDWFLSSQGDDAICAAANLVALGSLRFGAVKLTKLSRRFVMPETLDAFNLSWTVDPSDEGSIIVQGYLDRETVQRLFSYTRNYVRSHRSDLHTVRCPKVPQGFYYATKKHQPSSGSPKETRSSGTSGTDALLESTISQSSRSSKHSNDAKSTDSSTTEKPVDYESKGMNVTTYEELGTASNPSSANISSGRGSNKTPALSIRLGDSALREFLQEGRRISSAEDEVDLHVDERVAALEAITFFRAGVYAALLATGTDTSIILNSDKRYQLIQVQ